MLLILTNKNDSHADHLIRSARDSIPILRINTDDFLDEYEFAVGQSSNGAVAGYIEDRHGRRYEFTSKAVVWYRKPFFESTNLHIPEGFRQFAIDEVRAFFEVLYTLPSLYWVNDPLKAMASRSKWQQLRHAKRLGFNIPRSLITNSHRAAVGFCESIAADVVSKSIYTSSIEVNGVAMACATVKVSQDDLVRKRDSFPVCPTQLQEFIGKSFEVRATVVGTNCFAIKIDSQQSERTRVDWRVGIEECPHELIDLPPEISESCVRLIREQELVYGAIDIIVNPDGRFYFLEHNPFGQYLWLELLTGANITQCLIDHFVRRLASGDHT